jgi:SAM-dependent methyltransferase
VADIQRARRILDVGCGWGIVTRELAERCNAEVLGLDLHSGAIAWAASQVPHALAPRLSFMLGDAHAPELPSAAWDIILIQCGLLWMERPLAVLKECHRLLRPGGKLVILEPDFGGLMEFPAEVALADVWTAALQAVGAHPLIGRQLPAMCHRACLGGQFFLLDRYEPPQAAGFEFLKELPLDGAQTQRLQRATEAFHRLTPLECTVHLPFWLAVVQRGKDMGHG